jgi:lipopolysaccharide export system protein LptA
MINYIGDLEMKKFKRLLSIVLSILLVMTMLPTTLSAFAAGSEVEKITVYKTVKVPSTSWGTSLPTETFEITMVPATSDQLNGATTSGGIEVEAGPALSDYTLEFTFGAGDSTSSGQVEKSGDFDLDFVSNFTHTGVYRYYITETVNSNKTGYIDYATTVYYVDLYVQQDSSDSYYVANYVVYNAEKNTKPQKISFENEIYCADLIIAKQVDGVEYQQGEFYTFRILIPEGGTTITLDDTQEFNAQILDANSNVVIDTANGRTDAAGNVKIKVGGTDLESDMATYATEFKLKAGEKLKIIGAPVSMVYKVEEVTDTDQFKKEGYTVTYDYVEQGTFASGTDTNTTEVSDQEGSSVTGTINTSKNEVHFINSRIIETPTGVVLQVLPYALVVLVAACGIVLFVYKKRRSAC